MNDRYQEVRRLVGSWEYAKFGALVGVLLAILVIAALIRPLLFGRWIPAVLGWDLPMVPVNAPEKAGPLPAPAVLETPLATEPALPAGAPVEPDLEDETAIYHNVAPGENLQRIADSYGISVDELVSANDITDPDRIRAGTVLLIPQPQP